MSNNKLLIPRKKKNIFIVNKNNKLIGIMTEYTKNTIDKTYAENKKLQRKQKAFSDFLSKNPEFKHEEKMTDDKIFYHNKIPKLKPEINLSKEKESFSKFKNDIYAINGITAIKQGGLCNPK